LNRTLSDGGALRAMRWLCACAIVLTLAVISASAYLRLSQAGLACADSARCDAGALRSAASSASAPPAAQTYVRMAHRVAATGVALLMLALVVVSWKWQRAYLRIVAGAFSAMLFLALLGGAAHGSRLPAVTLGNLGGGWLLLSALGWLYARSSMSDAAVMGASWRRFVAIGLALLVVQLALGGWASADFAAVSCLRVPLCIDAWGPDASFAQLNPFATPKADGAGRVIASPAAVFLLWMHRVSGFVVAAYLLWLGAKLRRQEPALRHFGWLLLLLVALQVGLGSSSTTIELPLASAVMHNGVAALLLLALVSLYGRLGH
jgi:heme a synthase